MKSKSLIVLSLALMGLLSVSCANVSVPGSSSSTDSSSESSVPSSDVPVVKVGRLTFGTARYQDSDKPSVDNVTVEGITVSSLTSENSYHEAGSALRVGSSKNPGSLSIGFSGDIYVKSLNVIGYAYDDSSSVTVNVEPAMKETKKVFTSQTEPDLDNPSAGNVLSINDFASSDSMDSLSVSAEKGGRFLLSEIVVSYVEEGVPAGIHPLQAFLPNHPRASLPHRVRPISRPPQSQPRATMPRSTTKISIGRKPEAT